MSKSTSPLAALLLAALATHLAIGHSLRADEVADPAGPVPVLHQVDVAVIGGGSGAVAAAVAAAGQGATVFLAAPRTYLGDDIAATYRYWLEPAEMPFDPLSRAVFWSAAPEMMLAENRVPFTYKASRPAWRGHADPKGTALTDGKWGDSRTESVQYENKVTLTLDFQGEQALRKVHALVYQRPRDFRIARIGLAASVDGTTWTPCGQIENPTSADEAHVDRALRLSAAVAIKARYLKLDLEGAAGVDRILLGEIVVEREGPANPASVAQAAANAALPTPMQVKRALDQALITAKVPFLFSSFPVDLLVDAGGQPAGVIIANQSGRQAIVAKVIIDATERATVARWTGARFSAYPAGPQTFRRVVVGGPAKQAAGLRLVPAARPRFITDTKGRQFPLHEYEFTLPMEDGGPRAFAAAEQAARDLTWTTESIDAAEHLFQVPPDAMTGQQSMRDTWRDPASVPLAALQPAGVGRMFVLGGCADVARETAARLTRPVHLMALGGRVGVAAAALAKGEKPLAGVRRAGTPLASSEPSAVRYPTREGNFRATGGAIVAEASRLPVIGRYDVIVAGGGTGGAPAAIAAGRAGAKAAVLEYLDTLGGVGTAGMISLYYHGNEVGFSNEIDAGVERMGGILPDKGKRREWMPNTKAEWYRQEMRKAKVDVWFSALAVGVVVESGKVRGLVVATPQGRGVLLAKVVVDSTGNAAVAAAAGAECTYTGAEEIAVQGTGLPARFLEPRYTNTDYTYVDETDILDIWRAFVVAREKFPTAFDGGQLIDTRERRRIIGDVELKPTDAVLRRTWPDTVMIAKSDFDSHGYTVHPLFMYNQPDRTQYEVPVPYRALLPRGLDGILVTGLGISAHRDTLPLVRMQRDIQNQGYAAGTAAAMVAQAGIPTRQLNIRALQAHLIEKNILPPAAASEVDSFPVSPERLRRAVDEVAKDPREIAVILASSDAALPLLRTALAQAADPGAKLAYAHILGLLGDGTGAPQLRAEIARASWDAGWQFKGMGQYGASLSRLDTLIIALGRSRQPDAVAPIVEKARLLTPKSEFSHFRAVALALEAIGDPAAAKPLADLLALPGMTDYHQSSIQSALTNIPAGAAQNVSRGQEMVEIALAGALYRCGDHAGRGEAILRNYADDLRGHYARHARAVLATKRLP